MNQTTLDVVGLLSAALADAEQRDDAAALAAIIAACRVVEARALNSLADRVTLPALLQAQANAVTSLGW